MSYTEETVTTNDGLRLYIRTRELQNPRAEILISHGFGEHCGRYGPLTDHLAACGYSVTAYDHRGHGLSDGLPGHVESFTEYDDDLDKVISTVNSRARSPRLFLIAHSMGGLIAIRRLERKGDGLTGAVISAPLLDVAVPVPAHKLLFAKVATRMSPRLRLDNEINPANLSRDPEVGRAYAADPLVNRKVSSKWFSEATRAMREAAERAGKITTPLLVMHGTEDRLASVDATRRVFELIGSKDKELVIYPGFYHELFNEPEKQEVFERVTAWLNARAT